MTNARAFVVCNDEVDAHKAKLADTPGRLFPKTVQTDFLSVPRPPNRRVQHGAPTADTSPTNTTNSSSYSRVFLSTLHAVRHVPVDVNRRPGKKIPRRRRSVNVEQFVGLISFRDIATYLCNDNGFTLTSFAPIRWSPGIYFNACGQRNKLAYGLYRRPVHFVDERIIQRYFLPKISVKTATRSVVDASFFSL